MCFTLLSYFCPTKKVVQRPEPKQSTVVKIKSNVGLMDLALERKRPAPERNTSDNVINLEEEEEDEEMRCKFCGLFLCISLKRQQKSGCFEFCAASKP
jgi:hypothetical protein